MAMPLVIEEMWAWVSTDADGEGIFAVPVRNNTLSIPLVGADRERMESYRGLVQSMVNLFGVPATLVKFSVREQLDVIIPDIPVSPESDL